MEQNPKISVVITTKNSPDRLRNALYTVDQQTFKDIEIIVVDAIDSDICKLISINRGARYIPIKDDIGPPHGVQDARNLGATLSKAEFVAYLDDDDSWEPTKLEKQYNEIIKNSNIGLVTSHMKFVDSKGKEHIEKKKQIISYKDLLKGFEISSTSSLLFRKRALFEVGGWRHTRGMQEYDVALRIANEEYIIYCVQEPLMIQHETRLGGIYWKIAEQFTFLENYKDDVFYYWGWKGLLKRELNLWFSVILYISGLVLKDRIWEIMYKLKVVKNERANMRRDMCPFS